MTTVITEVPLCYDFADKKQRRTYAKMCSLQSESYSSRGREFADTELDLIEKFLEIGDANDSFDEFLRTGEYRFHHGENIILIDDDGETYLVCDGNIFYSGTCSRLCEDIEKGKKIKPRGDVLHAPEATVLPYDLPAKANEGKPIERYFTLAVNADMGDEIDRGPEKGISDETVIHRYSFPVLSYECVRNLLKLKNGIDVGKLLANGKLVITDYTPDQSIPYTAQESKVYKEAQDTGQRFALKPPRSGFTAMSWCWHMPSTVVLQYKNKSYLLGQDEEQYFGVELPEQAKTVTAAFRALIPRPLRKIPNLTRQGEWFFVPVDKEKVPARSDCKLVFNCHISESAGMALGRDDDESSFHFVGTDDGRVDKNGRVFALDPTLVHSEGQHSNVTEQGWIEFVRNTAVQSVSVEGVD